MPPRGRYSLPGRPAGDASMTSLICGFAARALCSIETHTSPVAALCVFHLRSFQFFHLLCESRRAARARFTEEFQESASPENALFQARESCESRHFGLRCFWVLQWSTTSSLFVSDVVDSAPRSRRRIRGYPLMYMPDLIIERFSAGTGVMQCHRSISTQINHLLLTRSGRNHRLWVLQICC